jgi:hypothetical protein
LESQLIDGDKIIIVAQDNIDKTKDLQKEFDALPITVISSARGAALGRNIGVKNLPDGDFVLHFPNDTSWFKNGAVMDIRSKVSSPDFQLGGVTVIDELGPRANLSHPGTHLTLTNAWSVFEVGLLIRRKIFEILDGFDSSIGTGANSPWQSGEATDLILRALAKWPELSHKFIWLPDTVAVCAAIETHKLSRTERRQKLFAYARGMGWVSRQHHCPVWWKVKRLFGRLTIGIRSPEYEIMDGWWGFLGAVEGMLGKTFGRNKNQAVSR